MLVYYGNTIIYIKFCIIFVERSGYMARRNFKLDPNRERKTFKDMPTVRQGEFAKLVATRAGINQDVAYEAIKAIPYVIKDLLIKGYSVNIYNFGTFYLRKVKMPVYRKSKKEVSERREKYSFSFKRAMKASIEINKRLLGEDYNE